VIDLINARSEIALTAAARQMNGDLTSILTGVETALHDLRVIVEAGIDFPDDVQGDGWWDPRLPTRFHKRVIAPIEALIRRYEEDHVFRDGFNLAIIGKPNVGKSSLMNCLLGKERAIVTDRPGTTRDLIEDSLKIYGVPVNLIDTAGLHDTDDPIESLGIQKTRQGIAAAQQVLFVVEGHKPLTDADLHIYAACRSKEMVLVLNKMDLVAAAATALKIPADFNGVPQVPISALYHRGIDALKDAIVAPVIGEKRDGRSHGAIPNLRHKVALERALNSAQAVATGIAEQRSAELIAIDLKEALDAILDISGRRADADLLDGIFSRFCIGK
jgi:tRNA modification GTPase